MPKKKVTITRTKSVKPVVPPLNEPYSAAKEAKGKVMEMELTNLKSIILWRSDSKWWKMCQNSALIYAYKVAPALEKSAVIRIDTDRYYNSPDGVCSIPNIEKFTASMTAYGAKVGRSNSEDVKVFILPEPFTKKMLDDFRLEERGRRDKLNKIIAGKNLYPFITSESRKALSVTYNLVIKLNQDRYDFVGYRLEQSVLDIFIYVTKMDRQELPPTEALLKILDEASLALTYINIIYEMRFVDSKKIEGIAKHIYNVKTEATRAVKDLEELK